MNKRKSLKNQNKMNKKDLRESDKGDRRKFNIYKIKISQKKKVKSKEIE